MSDEVEESPEEVKSLGHVIAKGATEPMFRVRIQPGRYKYPNRRKSADGKVKLGKRQFVPTPYYPEGVLISIPAWFVATVGIVVIVYGLGVFAKILSGEPIFGAEKDQAEKLAQFDWAFLPGSLARAVVEKYG